MERLIAVAVPRIPPPPLWLLLAHSTMRAVVAFLVLLSSLSLSLSLALFGEEEGLLSQERWRVATRAFNRDRRSCHGPGDGITIRKLSSLYRPRFICIKVRARITTDAATFFS